MRFSMLYHPRPTPYLAHREYNSESPARAPATSSSKPPETCDSRTRTTLASTDTLETPPVRMTDDDEPTPESGFNPGMALMEHVQTKHLLPRKRRRIHREDLPEDHNVKFIS